MKELSATTITGEKSKLNEKTIKDPVYEYMRKKDEV